MLRLVNRLWTIHLESFQRRWVLDVFPNEFQCFRLKSHPFMSRIDLFATLQRNIREKYIRIDLPYSLLFNIRCLSAPFYFGKFFGRNSSTTRRFLKKSLTREVGDKACKAFDKKMIQTFLSTPRRLPTTYLPTYLPTWRSIFLPLEQSTSS